VEQHRGLRHQAGRWCRSSVSAGSSERSKSGALCLSVVSHDRRRGTSDKDVAVMGILYAKVGGTFVPIAQSGPMGPSGGPVPVGGAVGDVIIKNGDAGFAVRWRY